MSIRILDFDDGFTSASVPSGGILSDIFLDSDGTFYIGDNVTDGSWRFYLVGGNIQFEKRISGTWTPKETIQE